MAPGRLAAEPWIRAALQCLCLASIGFAASSPQYLGCFVNEDPNVSHHVIVSLASITPQTCSDECLAQNYTYAEVHESSCRCTNNYASKLQKTMDDECEVSCAGNSSNLIVCDRTRFKMFKTKDTSEKSYPQAVYLGCYGEKEFDGNNRLLKFPHIDYDDNTPQNCSNECYKMGFLYSGTTNGMEKLGAACWCGNQYPSKRFKVNELKCDTACIGDKTKICGGSWKISIYSTGIIDYPLGNPIGCFHLDEYKNHKYFGSSMHSSDSTITTLKGNNDPHRCFYLCNEKGYKYAAVSDLICECSHNKLNLGYQKLQEECKKCEGDETEFCGNDDSVSLYENVWTGTGNLSGKPFGCFKNSWMYPVMEGWNISFPRLVMTSEICISSCYTRGYPYAAVASLTECVCSFVSPSLEAKVDGRHCDAACADGSSGRACGGGRGHYDVFSTGLQTARVAGNYYMGCYGDDGKDKRNATVQFSGFNTPHTCSKHCYRSGFRYFGLEYRASCWCGNAAPDERLKTADGQCSSQCPGNANKYCGGPSNMAVFHMGTIADKIRNCSTSCECYFLPTQNTSTINCSNKNLTASPAIFPIFGNASLFTDLILKNNRFEVQPNLASYDYVTLLDFSGNRLTTLDSRLLPKSLKTLYIDSNQFTTLNDNTVRLMRSLDSIRLSKNPWPCECELRVVLKELGPKIEDLHEITCTSSTQPLISMSEYDLCKKWKINYFYVFIALGFVLFVCFLSVYFDVDKSVWSHVRDVWCKSRDASSAGSGGKQSSEVFMQRIQYDELVLATNNWDNNRVLGRGGFGVVYKGNWRHTDVAIKRLKSERIAERVVNMHTMQNDELLNPSKEIMYLNAVKHDNILSMYGFCFHANGSCLIYQYMANGSLEDRLQLKDGTPPLSWSTRANIAVGTARGLQFLHNMETPLIHGDIKSANILLDSNFEARIGDFGLARTGPIDEANKDSAGFNVSRVCGTMPYLPDDFCQTKMLSTKVDTYSFGVVMFEIATGRKAFNRFKNANYLAEFVCNYDESSLSDIADKTAGSDLFRVSETLISLGKTCVVKTAENRPEMVVVYMKLQNIMPSNVDLKHSTVLADEKKTLNSQTQGAEVSPFKNKELMKLDGRKAALIAPLHEIPSISNLYTSPVHETDPRQIVTTEQKSDSNEITDEGFYTTDF